MTAPTAVGVVGLGAIGAPIAASLLRAGHAVAGTDIDPARTEAFARLGGTSVPDVRALARSRRVVLTLLPSAEALTVVADELLEGWRDGAGGGTARPVLIEMSTLDVETKRRARGHLAACDAVVLDCPVSGTAVQAAQGDLVVYASGDADTCAAHEELLRAFARGVHYLGPFGRGSQTKLIANMLVAVHIVAAAEALVLAQQAGLDADITLRALTDGAGTSRMLEVRGPMMIANAYDRPSMTLHLFLKDVRLIRELVHEVGAPSDLFESAATWLERAVGDGHGAQDSAAVVATVAAMAREQLEA